MDQGLNQKIDAYIAENKEQLLRDIAALVAIDSVEGTPEEGAPFGKGPRAALDKTLELAAGMGLATRNCENYMGYAELAGADPAGGQRLDGRPLQDAHPGRLAAGPRRLGRQGTDGGCPVRPQVPQGAGL